MDELVNSFEGKDELEIDRMREDFEENFEASPDDDWLIGSWVETNDGFYEPDPQGEFSAIVRESVVQVVQSKTIKRVSALCSPCYPGQADLSLDNIVPIDKADHGYLCFSLPDEYFYHEEVQNV